MTSGPLDTLRVVWTAMVGGVVVYTVVIFGLMSTGTLSLGVLGGGTVNVVGAVVMAYLALVVVGRRAIVSKIASEPDAEARLARYRVATIATLGFMEAGGLMVITMGLLSDGATWVLAGGGAAAALMFLARPSEEEAGL